MVRTKTNTQNSTKQVERKNATDIHQKKIFLCFSDYVFCIIILFNYFLKFIIKLTLSC